MFVFSASDHIQMDGTAAVAQPPRDQIHIPTWYEFAQEMGIMGVVWDGLEQPLGSHLNPPGESLKFIPAQQS